MNLDTQKQFPKIFEVEIKGWCYGIEKYPGEIFSGLIHSVIKEMSDLFDASLTAKYVFDIIKVSEQISQSARYLVNKKEIAFFILAQLPNPEDLKPEYRETLALIIDQVEQKYGGALERLEKKWNHQKNLLSNN